MKRLIITMILMFSHVIPTILLAAEYNLSVGSDYPSLSSCVGISVKNKSDSYDIFLYYPGPGIRAYLQRVLSERAKTEALYGRNGESGMSLSQNSEAGKVRDLGDKLLSYDKEKKELIIVFDRDAKIITSYPSGLTCQ